MIFLFALAGVTPAALFTAPGGPDPFPSAADAGGDLSPVAETPALGTRVDPAPSPDAGSTTASVESASPLLPSLEAPALAVETATAAVASPATATHAAGLLTVAEESEVKVTHYGTRFSGRKLGCDAGVYLTDDVTIVAVSPDRNKEWRCGYLLEICGEGGCIVGVRLDTCPGRGRNHVDLTEQGLDLVCGPDKGVCSASVRVYAAPCMIPDGIPATRSAVPDEEAGRLRAVVEASAVPERLGEIQEWTTGARSKSCR